RPEAVQAGCALLIGPSREAIVEHVARLLDSPGAHAQMASTGNPFGDGKASSRIAEVIARAMAPRDTPEAEAVAA
ncbi:MAG: UDP-N-acetylglucosamine 2-epimerase, partial [Burkholderiaceae bacterium]